MTRSARRSSFSLVGLGILGFCAVLLSVSVAFAGWKSSGEGGCGSFDATLSAAEPGDILTPMSSGVNTNGVTISKTLVLQGGWTPDSGTCESNGTNSFDSAAAMEAAGFVYQPATRSGMFGNFSDPVLSLNLINGETLVLQNLTIESQNANLSGIAISGVISDGARLRLENLNLSNNQLGVNGWGGAVYLEVRGGSQVIITGSTFNNNNAFSGGALRVHLYDGSQLIIEDSTFSGNEALGEDGGALMVLLHHGSVTIRNSTFSNNNATNGDGGAIRLERAQNADGPTTATLRNITYSGNSSEQVVTADISVAGVGLLEPQLYLPALFAGAPASPYSVNILDVTLEEDHYRVDYNSSGYNPQIPGRHIHFFFNTVPPTQAGAPGSGPWKIYAGPSPFTQYGIVDRPKGATQICALVANENHSVIQGTGNCVDLP